MGKKKIISSSNSATLNALGATSKSQRFTSVQLASLNAQSKPRISCFDPSATYFACSVSSMDRVCVKVWSCDTGDLLGEVKSCQSSKGRKDDDSFAIPMACQVTCLSWGLLALGGATTAKNDEKASKKKSKAADLSLVLFIGGIYLFSPRSALIFGELSASAAPHSSAIRSIQASPKGNVIYSFGEDGSMASWSIHAQNELAFTLESRRTFARAKGFSKALCLSNESFLLFNQKIALLSSASSTEFQFESQLSGHATDIYAACLSPWCAFGHLCC